MRPAVEEHLVENIRSLGDGASFWPDTCFVEIETEAVHSHAWEASPESLLAASGLFHEHVHWTQCHASSFGIFTFLLRHRRSEILECYLRSLDAAARERALREWERGEPLWRFGSEREEQPPSDRTLRRFREHWNALLTFDLVFRRGDAERGQRWDITSLFKTAYLHADGGFPLEEIFRSDEPFFDAPLQPSTPELSLPAVKRISCRALEECAAVLNQREFYSNADALWEADPAKASFYGQLEALHDRRWRGYIDDDNGLYASCITYFCEEIDRFDINDPDVCAVLLVIIDLALNPPVPPFVDLAPQFPRDGASRFSFGNLGQVHPVFRFVALVEAVRSIGLPTKGNALRLEGPDYAAYVARLCDGCGLPNPMDYLFALEEADTSFGVYRTLEDTPLSYMKAHVLNHHRKAARLRRLQPQVFASPSHSILYNQSFRRQISRNKLRSLLIDPLQIIHGTGFFEGITDREYFTLLSSAGFSMALSSLMSGGGTFFEQGLPRDAMHHGVVKRMQSLLVSRLKP